MLWRSTRLGRPSRTTAAGAPALAQRTAWLGCFTCPNAVIPLDADSLARLTAMRDALVAARAGMAPERWHVLYAPRLAILERDILPRFPDSTRAAATERQAHVPPIPVIE